MGIADGVDPKAEDILRYWFGEAWSTNRKLFFDQDKYHKIWFGGGPAVDEEIKQRFGEIHAAMAAGSLDKWIENPASAIAGVVLIDQMSRNMYRGKAQTYALDDKGLAWAKHILDTKMCDDFPAPMRFFLSMALEHSEALEDQNRSVAINRALLAEAEAATEAGDPDGPAAIKIFQQTLAYAIAHQEVVEKWGRFPHRNAILGRESTPEEVAGLANKTIRSF